MTDFLTTSQIAQMYGLASSTLRHYRASGRLVPTRHTPGGHARYALAEVTAVLGPPLTPGPEPRITGLRGETFAPPGQHDVRSSRDGGVPSAEIVALGIREGHERPGHPRWGGRLMKTRRQALA
jgi:hypothetical protein